MVDLVPLVEPTHQAIGFRAYFIYMVFILLSLLLNNDRDFWSVPCFRIPIPASPEDATTKREEGRTETTEHRMNLVTATGERWDSHIQVDEM